MVKIFYSVSGEGMGHAVRSSVIIEHLRKRHSVKIFSSGRVYRYLKKKFSHVQEIQGIYMKYKDNAVNEIGTIFTNIINMPNILNSLLQMIRMVHSEKPDLIISDYEAIASYAGFLTGIPVISIDNQHIFDRTKLSYPKKQWLNYMETRLVDRMVMITADYYFVTSFFFPEVTRKKTTLVRPIIRKKVLTLDKKEKDHFLVYQTSDTNDRLIETLKQIDALFIIYGFNTESKDKNLTFKKFNETEFLNDLAGSKAVITNGGFTLITESLSLGKPILSIPVRRQFEQVINAIHLQNYGYGTYARHARKRDIEKFMMKLEYYKKNLKRYKITDNSEFFNKLDSVIDRLARSSL